MTADEIIAAIREADSRHAALLDGIAATAADRRRLIAQLVEVVGSQADAARRLGVSPAAIRKALR